MNFKKKWLHICAVLLAVSLSGNSALAITPSSISAWLFGFDKKTTFWTGVAALVGLGGLYSYKYYQNTYRPKNYLKDTILKNPKKALDYAQSFFDEYVVKMHALERDSRITPQQVTQKLRELGFAYHQKCPIFMIGECVTAGWGLCLLSRECKPRYREAFEERIKSALQEKLNANKGKKIRYAGFAVGGAFTDLVALTKTLEACPDAHVHIDLIDYKFTPYVAYLDAKGSRNIDVHAAVNFDTYAQKALQNIRAKKDERTTMDQLERYTDTTDLKAKQFLGFLLREFPKAKISLAVHDVVDSYLEYLAKNSLAHADVVAVADIQDDMVEWAINDYIKLCEATLNNNPTAHNIWLVKDDGWLSGKKEGLIYTLAFKPVDGFKEMEVPGDKKIYEKKAVI